MVAFSFQEWKADMVASGQCRQTIRRNRTRNPKPGDRLQLYVAQRTPQCKKLVECDPVASEAIPITIDATTSEGFKVHLDGSKKPLSKRAVTQLAKADGFKGPKAFQDFFEPKAFDKPFHGFVLRWQLVEPFMPSNSDQGYAFESHYCQSCAHYGPEGNACSILLDAMVGQAYEWIYLPDGPTCTRFQDKAERAAELEAQRQARIYQRREKRGQLRLFG